MSIILQGEDLGPDVSNVGWTFAMVSRLAGDQRDHPACCEAHPYEIGSLAGGRSRHGYSRVTEGLAAISSSLLSRAVATMIRATRMLAQELRPRAARSQCPRSEYAAEESAKMCLPANAGLARKHASHDASPHHGHEHAQRNRTE